MSRRAGWGRAAVAGLLLSLAACASFDVRPSLSRNYELVLIEPAAGSAEAMWLVRMQVAGANRDCDRRALAEASDECVADWREGLRQLEGRPPLEQVREVNRLVNKAVPHVRDDTRKDGADHWGSPLDTLRNGGDCEDLALLKRESLQALGWPEERLALLVGYSTRPVPPALHAALLVTLENGGQVVLDSAEPDVLLPRDNYHFAPAYAMTRTRIYKVMPWRKRWWRD